MTEDVAALRAFIDASPSPFHAVATAAGLLDAAGFTPVDEADGWPASIGAGRHYVVRDGSIVAWAGGPGDGAGGGDGWRIVGAHTDSPNLRIKPRPDTGRAGARQLGVEPYGGVLLNSWLGRDLGLSGRVALADGSLVLVKVDEPVLHIPQLAIHLDREIGTAGLKLNPQQHVTPIWGLGGPSEGGFRSWLSERVGGDAVAWDVMTHDLAPAAVVGHDRSLLAAPRLDNLASAWAAVDGLIRAGTGVVALWDHEEIGSDTNRGAGSPLLPTVLERIASGGDGSGREGFHRALAGSLCLSADMAHATHPNYADRHEPEHWIGLGGGPVVKTNVNQRYATDARSAAAFVAACAKAGVEPQWYAHRADLPCGSTIGPITAAKLGIPVVDVGAPMLAMHSARELMAVADVEPYRDVLAAFLAAT